MHLFGVPKNELSIYDPFSPPLEVLSNFPGRRKREKKKDFDITKWIVRGR